MMQHKTKNLTTLALLCALLMMLALTPLGFLQIGPVRLTFIHLPVIVGGILLGTKGGLIMGFIFGLASLWTNTMAPSLLSFMFSPLIPLPGTTQGSLWAMVICFGPRMLLGFLSGYLYQKDFRGFKLGVCVTLLHTMLVFGGMLLFFAPVLQEVLHVSISGLFMFLGTLLLTNAIPEAFTAGFITKYSIPRDYK